jgi:PilZ domain
MTTAARAQSERRIYPRHRVRVAVVWRTRGEEPIAAEICDLSAQGMFIVATSALPDDVGTGDATEISIATSSGRTTLTGIVRWRGYHPLHQAIGCGVLLDEPSAHELKRLFPGLPL